MPLCEKRALQSKCIHCPVSEKQEVLDCGCEGSAKGRVGAGAALSSGMKRLELCCHLLVPTRGYSLCKTADCLMHHILRGAISPMAEQSPHHHHHTSQHAHYLPSMHESDIQV